MTTGRLIGVVGPSGVGKDSVISGLAASHPDIRPVLRAITRAPGLGGERYHALTETEFETAQREGAFCLHWKAHGLCYGIPAAVLLDVRQGQQRIANLSRRILPSAAGVFPEFVVLNITADPEVLEKRLAARGREKDEDIAARLARAADPIDPSIPVITLRNDGPLADTVQNALYALTSRGVP